MTKRTHLLSGILLVAALALASASCKKNDEATTSEEGASTEGAEPAAKPNEAAEPIATGKDQNDEGNEGDDSAADTEDYVIVEARHSEPKPDDPVEVRFGMFEVVSARFEDPSNLEGGTAELEVNLASLESGIPKRDKHLKSPDYLDVEASPTATIRVEDVTKEDDTHYTANAAVTLGEVSVTWPVEFEVVASTGDSVTIVAEHEFERRELSVGKTEDDPVADDLTVKVRLTLQKSS